MCTIRMCVCVWCTRRSHRWRYMWRVVVVGRRQPPHRNLCRFNLDIFGREILSYFIYMQHALAASWAQHLCGRVFQLFNWLCSVESIRYVSIIERSAAHRSLRFCIKCESIQNNIELIDSFACLLFNLFTTPSPSLKPTHSRPTYSFIHCECRATHVLSFLWMTK